ncbi:MAG: hypothetical protein KAG34_07890 [Cocleimonas sp.]|nr:hypothetical protein [Cocleimonas sp.]
MKPNPKRSYSSQQLLISELKNNSEKLRKLLSNIITNTESSILKKSAEEPIKSIEELIKVIENSNQDEIKEISLIALNN